MNKHAIVLKILRNINIHKSISTSRSPQVAFLEMQGVKAPQDVDKGLSVAYFSSLICKNLCYLDKLLSLKQSE